MKNTLLALALVLSILTISAFTQQPKSQQWEYKFDYKCNEKRANDLAGDGWELTSMSMASYGTVAAVTCVFKRGK